MKFEIKMARWTFTLMALLIPLAVLAQDTAALDTIEGALAEAFNAAQRGQWTLTGILAAVAFVHLARRYGTALVPVLASDVGGTLLATVGTPLVALAGFGLAGKPLTRDLVEATFTTTALGATVWTTYRRAILKALVPLAAGLLRRVPVVGPIAAAFIERPLGLLLDAARKAILKRTEPALATSTSAQKAETAPVPSESVAASWGGSVGQGIADEDRPPG